MLLGLAVMAFAACDKDIDSNPTLQTPETFKLNTPAYSQQLIDLENSSSLDFTWSQPDYGIPLSCEYGLQFSIDGNFTTSVDEAEADESGTLVADYWQSATAYSTPSGSVAAADLAKGLMQIKKWEDGSVPSELTVMVRAFSDVNNDTVYSNTVPINVAPYYVELTDAEIEMWYLIGACIGDGKWTNSPSAIGTSIYPMSIDAGCEYDKKTGKGKLTFTGYLTTDGFKLVHTLDSSWPDQWGQGDAFGTFVKNDGGSSNITVPENGYYTITLDTDKDELTIAAADITPTVYDMICITGAFAGDDWPNVDMTPVNTVASMAGHNHIWSYTLDTTSGDTTAKFKIADSWATNWGADTFPYGVGVNDGANIPVTAGKYIVTFNDIDGSYAFTAVE